jgi:hypothetical protein
MTAGIIGLPSVPLVDDEHHVDPAWLLSFTRVAKDLTGPDAGVPSSSPLADPNTGFVTDAWYRFFVKASSQMTGPNTKVPNVPVVDVPTGNPTPAWSLFFVTAFKQF